MCCPRENPKRQPGMVNPQKLATLGTQDEDNPNKNAIPKCVGHHYAQTNPNNINIT
jgi:hypothetical protein